MGAAILCTAVCISDVTNKAGMFGKSIKYITLQANCLSLVKRKPKWLRPEDLKLETKKVILLHKCWRKNQVKPADGSICTVYYVFNRLLRWILHQKCWHNYFCFVPLKPRLLLFCSLLLTFLYLIQSTVNVLPLGPNLPVSDPEYSKCFTIRA